MAQAQLKMVNGILMLPLPADMQAELSLTPESAVEVDLQGRELIVRATGAASGRRSRYTLTELLADYDQIPRNLDEDRIWLNAPPVGRELI